MLAEAGDVALRGGVPNFGGDWLPDADKAAASADIPGPGCDELAGPGSGDTPLVYELGVNVWPGADIWWAGDDPT